MLLVALLLFVLFSCRPRYWAPLNYKGDEHHVTKKVCRADIDGIAADGSVADAQPCHP